MLYPPHPSVRSLLVESFYTAFEYAFPGGSEFEEAHDFWELLCTVEGEMNVTTDNEVHLLRRNEAVLHRPMQFHRHTAAPGITTDIIVISFDASRMPLLDHYVFRMEATLIRRLQALIRRVEEVFRMEHTSVLEILPGRELAAQQVLAEFEVLLADIISSAVSEKVTDLSAGARLYAQAISYLHDNIHTSLTAPEIAQALSISLSTLNRLFSRFAGTGVMTFFQKMRITKAAERLAEGLSVGTVADELGYPSLSSFSVAFRRVMHTSPGSYKRSQRERRLLRVD